jgi:hypothetical protein
MTKSKDLLFHSRPSNTTNAGCPILRGFIAKGGRPTRSISNNIRVAHISILRCGIR